jgi:hypothetical protein
MACKIIGNVIVCGPRPRRRALCQQPGCAAEYTKLCDYPLPYNKGRRRATCDRRLCDRCAVHVHLNRDHCPDHPKKLDPTL